MKNLIASDIRNSHSVRGLFACVIVLMLITTGNLATAAEPVLELAFAKQRQKLARSDLLRHPDVRTISIPADVSYKRKMEYRALPLKSILRTLHGISTVQFKSDDGFVANIPAELLSGASEPWLAIEAANAPWPELKPGGRSAGAFYLVWISPEKSNITPEFWPYQIAVISEISALTERYPQILPDASLKKDSAEYRGMQAYITHCSSCHQINGGGDAKLGPDLNLPFNPTEYFQADFLRKYMRDPAAVRNWPQLTMPGFSPSVMNDAQLDDLLAYLHHMTQRKQLPADAKN
ncbi:c-type cytochrome [Herminiimonas fonticola]|uniref:Mono/diheme cytochrome c family protein n=1 Tax=Herminiimonas fonticola TaxID=303380 RepID=A0A4R6GHM6_9BURK|nr:cytochrome c [Herminiimonas fonticola]RBA25365.1 Cytochrome c [Herminiimonas fonticola]TDN94479.1 mono/diheme cytochrome c family protein [Herminiimonas fonticola]